DPFSDCDSVQLRSVRPHHPEALAGWAWDKRDPFPVRRPRRTEICVAGVARVREDPALARAIRADDEKGRPVPETRERDQPVAIRPSKIAVGAKDGAVRDALSF